LRVGPCSQSFAWQRVDQICYNIKMNLREIAWGGMDWIDLAQDRDQWKALAKETMNFRVPSNIGKFLSSCTTGSLSRRAQLHGVS
jgi:hypothetical protein